MEQKIRWGIIGLGRIAHKFASDLNLVDGSEITAVASRSMDKAKVFAEQHQAKYAFGSYQALFECGEVDVVYIATPHTGHKEWSIKAMNHGKHVLCEKPMGMDRSDVEEMLSVAGKNQVFLMEALWSRFNPSIKKVKAMVDAGEIGEVGYLHADFAFYALDRPEEGRLLNPDLGGGSLLDIGIYPIFLSYLLLGMPEAIKASSRFYKTGVEIQTSLIFDYPKAQAILYSGFTSYSKMEAEISGSKGAILINGQWHAAQGYCLEMEGHVINDVGLPTSGNGYTYEIEEVNSCLQKGKLQSGLWTHQNSLDLAELLETIRVQNGIKFPFE
ncbi:MAG: oxidoreductase [Maribacter sp.]|nr:MAG: oxidoreductase [Maribacter sp.]